MRYSKPVLLLAVIVTVMLFFGALWLLVRRHEVFQQVELVRAAISNHTSAPLDVRAGVNGFGLNADFQGTPISAATAQVLADNRHLHYFVFLNCPVAQTEVTILNKGDWFIMVGDDDEPPRGSLQGHRIVRSDGKRIEQTNF